MDIVLHIGAHKTASTYLQQRVALSAANLEKLGIVTVRPKELRARVAAAQTPFNPLNRLRRVRRGRRAGVISRIVRRAEAAGARWLMISEENVLGPMGPLLGGAYFYDGAAGAVARLVPAFAGHRLTVALSVRSYPTFFTSVWGHQLRSDGYRPFDDALKACVLAKDRGWPDMVREISGVLPDGARLVLWRHEDLGDIEDRIIATLVGPCGAEAVAPIDHRPLAGPSRRAIRRLEAITRQDGPPGPETITRVLRVQSKAKGLARYDPWTPDESRALERRYREDMAAIGAMEQVTMLDTATPSASHRPPPTASGRSSSRDATSPTST